MSAPPFKLVLARSVEKTIDKIKKLDHRKNKKVQAALQVLRTEGPGYPSLRTKRYHSDVMGRTDAFESYVENDTPGAWRIWWVYAPEADTIIVIAVGPHP